MDNVGFVVEDLPATIAFVRELGLELEGRAMVDQVVPLWTVTNGVMGQRNMST